MCRHVTDQADSRSLEGSSCCLEQRSGRERGHTAQEGEKAYLAARKREHTRSLGLCGGKAQASRSNTIIFGMSQFGWG